MRTPKRIADADADDGDDDSDSDDDDTGDDDGDDDDDSDSDDKRSNHVVRGARGRERRKKTEARQRSTSEHSIFKRSRTRTLLMRQRTELFVMVGSRNREGYRAGIKAKCAESKWRTSGIVKKQVYGKAFRYSPNEMEVSAVSTCARRAAAGIETHEARLNGVPEITKHKQIYSKARDDALLVLKSVDRLYLSSQVKDDEGKSMSVLEYWETAAGIPLVMRLLERCTTPDPHTSHHPTASPTP